MKTITALVIGIFQKVISICAAFIGILLSILLVSNLLTYVYKGFQTYSKARLSRSMASISTAVIVTLLGLAICLILFKYAVRFRDTATMVWKQSPMPWDGLLKGSILWHFLVSFCVTSILMISSSLLSSIYWIIITRSISR